ncbi:GyrI-like domain-containing protein [Allomuricauda sp. SCSIO 65647]|uniref:GyrI-like domain-containing protein n=1 Tax=Allomuricauda sp. SCSIO 65647 TaxID=2908843 RepID=UPI001F214BF6|nr:GyrI-like domain-containing protein [Muricauda sp. SCSIO 65647]UJH66610.1 GyrI-like domain-containing protein [Muricauda sp. SCSIO 65647]
METHIDSFYVVGIAIQSTNEGEKSVADMGKLWGRFYSEGISKKIPNKESEAIYSIFMDYESDYTGKYTALIGHKVQSLEKIPEGMIGREIIGCTYQKFISKGKMPDAIVDTWKEIWKKDAELNRKYRNDFEVYGDKSDQGENSEVEIYLSINKP